MLDTNAALTFDATLAVGDAAQTIHATDNTVHVEASSTQMGEVISGRQMTAVPFERSRLYRSSIATARRCTLNLNYFKHRPGCWDDDP